MTLEFKELKEELNALVTEHSITLKDKAQLLDENKRLHSQVNDIARSNEKLKVENTKLVRELEALEKVINLEAEKAPVAQASSSSIKNVSLKPSTEKHDVPSTSHDSAGFQTVTGQSERKALGIKKLKEVLNALVPDGMKKPWNLSDSAKEKDALTQVRSFEGLEKLTSHLLKSVFDNLEETILHYYKGPVEAEAIAYFKAWLEWLAGEILVEAFVAAVNRTGQDTNKLEITEADLRSAFINNPALMQIKENLGI